MILLSLLSPAYALELTDKEIASLQTECSDMPVGERIAFWAEKFVGTPYDPDPMGVYVTDQVIVADDAVDCMYLTFRAAELALSNSPAAAVEAALSMRFPKKGVLEHGEVMNYDDRFQYAMDMLRSGKWGTDITPTLPGATEMKGSRGVEKVLYLPAKSIPGAMGHLRSGDIVYFVKDPSKRVVGEIVGHIGIIKREGKREDNRKGKPEDATLYLIHASGHKNRGGEVKRVLFGDYVNDMPFAGIIVGRF